MDLASGQKSSSMLMNNESIRTHESLKSIASGNSAAQRGTKYGKFRLNS